MVWYQHWFMNSQNQPEWPRVQLYRPISFRHRPTNGLPEPVTTTSHNVKILFLGMTTATYRPDFPHASVTFSSTADSRDAHTSSWLKLILFPRIGRVSIVTICRLASLFAEMSKLQPF